MLLAAAGGTALLRIWLDTAVILGVVAINAAIGFVQEGKAERALEAIRGMLSPKALVVREGQRRQVPAAELVPGDVVRLGAGDRVCADLRLVQVKDLRIDEAVLTGEAEAVEKGTEPVGAGADLGDRTSMAYSGTLVTAGQGLGVVVATGGRTELGRISALVGEVQEVTTPLLRQVDRFGRSLSVAILAVAAVTFAVGYGWREYPLGEAFLAAVSLVVAAIPEGLPAIMSVTLAVGVQGMARRNAIIRRLPAVETLGAVSVICSDKTGTLTRNEMTVTSVLTGDARYEVSGVGYERRGAFSAGGREVDPQGEAPALAECLRAGLLCNDARLRSQEGLWVLDGEPTEGALVVAAVKAGFDEREVEERFPRVDVIPFGSAHKFMATRHADPRGNAFACVKGAPERVVERCVRVRSSRGDLPMEREGWLGAMESIAAEGKRVLALATKEIAAGRDGLRSEDVEGGMTLLGLVGIVDPPREEAAAAVRACQEAGISVKMITGDHRVTARAVADALGIGTGGGVATGHEVEALDDAALRRVVVEADVFARASPEHKLRLVEALQAEGKVVAMTGDGVNDAPALKRADVGIAMGMKGTEAAKEAADMVLADDDFATIAQAVRAGRNVYDNLVKAILFLLPTNGGQALTIGLAIFLGWDLPLSPVQVLWVNMVTAVTLGIALAFEPPEPGVMGRPPRDPGRAILSGFLLWRVVFVSALLVGGTFGHFVWMRQDGLDLDRSRTIAINTLVAGQLFYLFNSRYVVGSSLRWAALAGNRAALLAVAALLVFQGAFTYLAPLQDLFGTAPIGAAEWGRILGFGVGLFLLVELEKLCLRGRGGR